MFTELTMDEMMEVNGGKSKKRLTNRMTVARNGGTNISRQNLIKRAEAGVGICMVGGGLAGVVGGVRTGNSTAIRVGGATIISGVATIGAALE